MEWIRRRGIYTIEILKAHVSHSILEVSFDKIPDEVAFGEPKFCFVSTEEPLSQKQQNPETLRIQAFKSEGKTVYLKF